jgi:ferric-dicitrate binding protein FerR (iron transport regulator)
LTFPLVDMDSLTKAHRARPFHQMAPRREEVADMKATCESAITVLLALILFNVFVGAASLAQQTAPPAEQTLPAASSPAFADSKVRIVRLSQVNAAVQMDRNIGHGFEAAMQNLPVTEGAKLKTGAGLAEVEFEDNSTLRLAPDTLIDFSQLELRPSGAKATTIQVLKGTVYVSLANTKGNEFTLTFGPESVSVLPSTHLRLELASAKATLSVFDGNVQVAGASDTATLGKKRTLTFDLAGQSQPALSRNVAENEYDAWDQQGVDYQKRYANSSAYGNSAYAFGTSDMNYYGSFSDIAGCGSMWRPYFASAAWNPYGSGVWAWYPGAGYSWVSPYPWGWMPYHYGSWGFCSGAGWGWMPGGSWMGLSNAPGIFSPLQPPRGGRGPSLPVRPLTPPTAGRSTLLPVNLEKLPASGLKSSDTFVFRNDSAGLGIPRGNLGKLDRFSAGAERHGSRSMVVYSVPLSTEAGNGRIAGGTESARQGSIGRGSVSSGSMGGGFPGGSAGHGGSASGSGGGHK